MHNSVTQQPSDIRPNRKTVSHAKRRFQTCGCFPIYEEYASLSREWRIGRAEVKRLHFCISEQCWSPDDAQGITLTEGDNAVPFPDVIHKHLSNRLRNAKAHSKEISKKAKEKLTLLKEKHSACPDRNRRHLNVLLDFAEHEAKARESGRVTEIISEIRSLIRESRWQNIVSPGKVLNLTDNEVGDEELEVLSLGIDFKLQSGNEIILDVAVGFESFDFKHKSESNKPDLQRDKVKLLSDIHKDSGLLLPRRYLKALRSLKANENIKVVQADKGRQVVICYMTTYRNLANSHFR